MLISNLQFAVFLSAETKLLKHGIEKPWFANFDNPDLKLDQSTAESRHNMETQGTCITRLSSREQT